MMANPSSEQGQVRRSFRRLLLSYSLFMLPKQFVATDSPFRGLRLRPSFSKSNQQPVTRNKESVFRIPHSELPILTWVRRLDPSGGKRNEALF